MSSENSRRRPGQPGKRFGLARILSKRGFCSRTQAAEWIRAGRVSVAGRRILDPEQGFPLDQDAIAVDGVVAPLPPRRRVLVLHKPRGYLVTRQDQLARQTIYDLLPDGDWLAPVGRLDQASSGLLLLSNDPAWAQKILDPERHLPKKYHVQVRPPLTAEQRAYLATGVVLDGIRYRSMEIRELRCGGKTQWLEFVLHEGKNRQIRRLLESLGCEVLRLIRVAIGTLTLGDLAAGQWRELTPSEMISLCPPFDLL
ncbi:MAG: pseudouridine synthase [Candidatus Igneacidithiobacillus chanchocoensis]